MMGSPETVTTQSSTTKTTDQNFDKDVLKSGGDEKKVTALLPPLKPKPPPRVA